MYSKTVLLFLVLLAPATAFCQSADTSAYAVLNRQRLQTNKTGMTVLGGWGAANLLSGIAGYLAADDREWKSFHEMNALWGLVNAGIAAAGYMGASREARMQYLVGDALHRYEATKRLFLINAGLDGVYIASGIYMTEHGKRVTADPGVWQGFGKSFILQGAGLLLFDGFMFAAHQHHDKRWYRLLRGVRVSGTGVGLCYTF